MLFLLKFVTTDYIMKIKRDVTIYEIRENNYFMKYRWSIRWFLKLTIAGYVFRITRCAKNISAEYIPFQVVKMRTVIVSFLITTCFSTNSISAQTSISLNLNTAKDTINKNIYGHFAEHLGHSIYGGF